MRISKKSKSKPQASNLESGLEAEDQVIGSPSREAFLELMTHIWRHKLYLFCGIILAITATVSTLLEPWILGNAVDTAIIPKDMNRLKGLAALLALVEFARVASLIGESYVFALLGQRVMQDLRVQLFSHILRIPVGQFDRVPVGRLVTRVTNDVASLADMFASGFVTILGNVLVAVGILVSLIVINWKLGLITACVFPALIMLSVHFSRRLKLAYTAVRARLSALNAFLAESILGMRTLHFLNRQQIQNKKFVERNELFADAQFGSVRIFALFQPTITLCTGISMALLIWYGGGMVLSQEIKVGMLVSFFAYVMSLFQPVREVADKWNVILSGLTSAERVFAVLRWPLEPGSKQVTEDVVLKGHLRFENVWFAYKDENWVLKDFNLEVQTGEKIGIVGPTGSGKTTLISLLMRFYTPQRGRILLDGRDLNEWDLATLRKSIGFVQQDVFLFSGTTRENITLWRESEERGLQAQSFAPPDHVLQEGGGNLSRGERQIISFCRALYSRPKLWILDEATANVDSHSEQNLDALLASHSAGQTTMVIAHRLSTVRNLTRIIVLNQGNLIQQGTHEDLLRQDGLYARLYRYQNLNAQLGELPQEAEARHDHQLECKS